MAFPTAAILDNFNRSDGPPPAGWSAYIAVGLVTTGTQCAPNSSSSNGAYWSTSFGGAGGTDIEAYVTVATLPPTTGETSIMCRLNPAGGGVVGTCYEVNHAVAAGNDTITLSRFDGDDSRHTLASYSWDLSAGDGLGISCVGSTITAWFQAGGVWYGFSATDSTYNGSSPNQKVALYNYGNGVNTASRYDDFGGGVSTASGPTLPSSGGPGPVLAPVPPAMRWGV